MLHPTEKSEADRGEPKPRDPTRDTRKEITAVSVKAAAAVNYRGAGTIEFLLDKDRKFYFIEMNTRLQVEHPVTEMVTGIDLVKWQIRIASGMPLDFKNEDVPLRGHAIECRINAENPSENFRPCCGKVTLLHIPSGPWVRFDTALYQDYSVPPFYDSLIGKLIVHREDKGRSDPQNAFVLMRACDRGDRTQPGVSDEYSVEQRI